MKACHRCHQTKPPSNFCKKIDTRDGLNPICRACSKIINTAYRESKRGFIAKLYGHQLEASRKRGHTRPAYTLDKLREWALLQDKFHALFATYKASGFKKDLAPSFDRLDDYSPYSLDNIQIITWDENNRKHYADVRSGVNNKTNRAVIQHTKDSVFIKKHHSICSAGRATNCAASNIRLCCQGKRNSAKGFKWQYANNERN